MVVERPATTLSLYSLVQYVIHLEGAFGSSSFFSCIFFRIAVRWEREMELKSIKKPQVVAFPTSAI